MPDVFLIGCAIGYSRVEAYVPVRIATGGWCMIGDAFMAMMTRASLDRQSIWSRIQTSTVPRVGAPPIGCTACDLVIAATAEGERCPRCRERVWRRKPFAVTRAAALTMAGFLLYPVANIYPDERVLYQGPYISMEPSPRGKAGPIPRPNRATSAEIRRAGHPIHIAY